MACVDPGGTQPTKAAALVAQLRPDAHVNGADAAPADQPHVRSFRKLLPCRGRSWRSSSALRPAVGSGGMLVAVAGGIPAVPVSQGTHGAGSSLWANQEEAWTLPGRSRHAAAVTRTADEGVCLMVVYDTGFSFRILLSSLRRALSTVSLGYRCTSQPISRRGWLERLSRLITPATDRTMQCFTERDTFTTTRHRNTRRPKLMETREDIKTK